MFEELKDIKVLYTSGGYLVNSLPGESVTLDVLYKEGWWITEIFGSTAVLIHKGSVSSKHSYFRCVFKTITIDNITPSAMRIIKKIRTQRWNEYKRIMLKPEDKRYRMYNDRRNSQKRKSA